MSETKVDIKSYGDVVAARQAGRELAQALGFGAADQTRLATAISELTTNVIRYAGEGVCTVVDESNERWRRISVLVEDNGPGISDVDEAMTQGFSTGKSLGAGLPGTRRLVDEFTIESEPGRTRVAIAMIRPRRQGAS